MEACQVGTGYVLTCCFTIGRRQLPVAICQLVGHLPARRLHEQEPSSSRFPHDRSRRHPPLESLPLVSLDSYRLDFHPLVWSIIHGSCVEKVESNGGRETTLRPPCSCRWLPTSSRNQERGESLVMTWLAAHLTSEPSVGHSLLWLQMFCRLSSRYFHRRGAFNLFTSLF